jgi:hypothetical protein
MRDHTTVYFVIDGFHKKVSLWTTWNEYTLIRIPTTAFSAQNHLVCWVGFRSIQESTSVRIIWECAQGRIPSGAFCVQNHLKYWTFSRFVREFTVERNPLPAISVQNHSVCWITVRIIRELRWSESL